MTVAIITVGIPASGKSTGAAKLVAKGWLEANLDNERLALGLPAGAITPDLIARHTAVVDRAIATGTPLVVSDTNLNATFRDALMQKLADGGMSPVIQVMDTPFQVCMQRNANREGFARVPDDVMHRMWAAFEAQF